MNFKTWLGVSLSLLSSLGLAAEVTLNQSTADTITGGNSVSCNTGNLHADNSYFRVFDLVPLNLAGPISIHTVQVGIELANAFGEGTTQPMTINVYTQSGGAFPNPTRTLQTTQAVNVSDQVRTILSVPLAVPTPPLPANSTVVVEVFTPSGQAAGHSFFIGSNAAGQTGPSYLQAAPCGVTVPQTTAALGFPNMHMVLKAIGTVAANTLPQNLACGFNGINALTPATVTGPAQKNTMLSMINLASTYFASPYKSLGLGALDSVLARVDGCALRTTPDTVVNRGGAGMDFVTTCPAQGPIYACLKAARDQYVAP